MSDPDPVPSEAPPAPSRISDRAALEAALAGAASLVLGRLLLGRGAGLLAGTAAIAARLLADAAKQRKETAEAVTAAVEAKEEAILEEIAEEVAETEGWPPEPEVPPGAKPFPEAVHFFSEAVPDAMAVEAIIEQEEAIIEEIAEEVAEDDGWPSGEEREFKHLAHLSHLSAESSPAPADPFANLFEEGPPPAATGALQPAAEIDAKIEGFPDYQKATGFGEPHVPVVPQEKAAWSLPAFPSLTAAVTEQPAPVESPAVPPSVPEQAGSEIPAFPGLASDLPHPEEIWIRAKAETAPIALPEVPPAVSPPAGSDVALARGESSPFMIFPPTTPQTVRQEWAEATDVTNPFTALITQPVPRPEPEPPVTSPEPATVPALPSTPVILPVAPIVPAPPPMAPVAVERPIVAASPSTAAVAPADLPVISLKAPSNPAVIAQESKPVERLLITTPVETLPPDPTAATWPGVPPQSAEIPATGSAFKAWFVLLLIAAILIFLFRCEQQRVEAKTKTAAGPVPAGLPGNPAASPGAPETVAIAAPAAVPAENASGAKPLPALDQNFPPGSPEEKARQSLERLMMARSANELAGLVHHPVEAMRQAIQYFPDGNLNPVPILGITLEAIEPMAKAPYKVRIFRVVTDRVPAGFPVTVEDTAEGPRIDFTAFVQCRDQLLDQFVKQPAAGPGRFLVVLRRGHYFGEDLTQAELDRMICLEVASPNPSSAKYPVFVPRDTELGRLALRDFDWDKTYTPIVELAHANRHMALHAIVEETWRRGTP